MKQKYGILRWIYQRITPVALIGLLMCSIESCDQMTDNYQQYLKGGEIIYPAKADSIQAHPGKYRVELQFLLLSDPSVQSATVYWNNRQNFKTVSIQRTSGIDTVRVILDDLDEQTHTFEIYTFDSDGNQSVRTEAIGVVYGDRYRGKLFNRAIRSYDYSDEDGSLTIYWESADDGTVAEEFVYTDVNGQNRTISFSAEQEYVSLEDYNADLGFSWSTVFMPDPMAIDTFKTAFTHTRVVITKNITANVLKNTEMPFNITGPLAWGTSYYTVTDWLVNAANVNGSSSGGRGYTLTMIAWSTANVTSFVNGKLYQTVELDAGIYRFDVFAYETSATINRAYVVAALGNELHDTDVIEQESLDFAPVPTGVAAASNRQISVGFTLSEKSIVTLGFVASLNVNEMIHFRRVELWQLWE